MTRPYSFKRLLGFNLVELPRDANNQPGGPNYAPYKKTRDLRALYNLRGDCSGAWSERTYALASRNEIEVFWALEGNSNIIDIREQYPIASPGVLAALLAGEDVDPKRVMTLDFVVTLPPRNFGGPLRYTALSYKPDDLIASDSASRRSERERQRAYELGWSWHYVNRPTPLEVGNHRILRGWCQSRGLDDACHWARDLSELFYKTTSIKSLRGQLAMFGRRLRIPEQEQWFAFAAAYYLGFLALDHRYKLDEDLPPRLKARRE